MPFDTPSFVAINRPIRNIHTPPDDVVDWMLPLLPYRGLNIFTMRQHSKESTNRPSVAESRSAVFHCDDRKQCDAQWSPGTSAIRSSIIAAMANCPSCLAKQIVPGRFCSECGAALVCDEASTALHVAGGRPLRANEQLPPGDSSHHGRYLPGTTIANRYRIVSLVGKGGMGEVYRADDLKLGHAVALKFLPKHLAEDPGRMQLLLSEVRLARQVSHPNVCRVYDVGEVEGQHFLSMEYIDGEDLRILLRWIGRVPRDKGVQIAQQLCAGLAAAHDRGVLHCDLKPANIMLDGQGQVRITDFGLAKLAEDDVPGEVAGTPAYMAPEQLLSGETSPQSDLYALGLVLAEILLGKPINQTNDPAELASLYRSSTNSIERLHSSDIDPVVEQAILSCLARDPADRPRSARQLASALPGGDPLEAAVAAGMTPSPELVANATDKHLLRFPLAVTLLGVTVALLGASAYLNQRNTHMLDTPPEVLSDRCGQIMETLGYADLPANTTYGAAINSGIQKELQESAKDQAWLDRHPQPKYQFWRRWTDGVFMVEEFHAAYIQDYDAPILNKEQEATVTVDERGNLIELKVFDSKHAIDSTSTPEFDWSTLLALAGIDENDVKETRPVSNPPVYCDERIAWVVSRDGAEDRTIQAGAAGGRANYFEIIGLRDAMSPENTDNSETLVFNIVTVIVKLFVMLIAWLNIRASRADWKNALRAAALILLMYVIQELAALNSRSPDFAKSIFGLLGDRAWGHMLSHAFMVAVMYIATEPYIRRFWPRSMVGIARLLGGRLRDPIVGKELLAGITIGCVLYVVVTAIIFAMSLAGRSSDVTLFRALNVTIQSSTWIASIAHMLSSIFLATFILASLCVLARLVFRRIRFEYVMIAIALLFAAASAIQKPADVPWFAPLIQFCVLCAVPLVLTRVGLLALCVAGCSSVILSVSPPLHKNSWYAPYALGMLCFPAIVAVIGFVASQGGIAKMAQFFEASEGM